MFTFLLIGLCLWINHMVSAISFLQLPQPLRKEAAIKTHLLQTSKTDNYIPPLPPTPDQLGLWNMQKHEGDTSGLTEKTKLSKVAVLVDCTGAPRINSNWGRTVGTGRQAEGERLWETHHNDVFMLLGRQVCVLKHWTQKVGRNKTKQKIH